MIELLTVGKHESDVCDEVVKALIVMKVALCEFAANCAEVHWIGDHSIIVWYLTQEIRKLNCIS